MGVRKLTSRREFIRVATLGAASAALLSACGPAATPTPTAAPKPAEAPKPAGAPKPTEAPKAAAPAAAPTAAAAKPTEAPKAEVKPAAKGQTQLTYANYSTGTDKDLWETIAKNFNTKNPNVSVRYLPVPADTWGEYFDKLATQIAGGNPPDVVRVAIEGTQLFAAKGLALPYDDLMKGDAEIAEFQKDVNPRLLKVFVVNGKTYEFPLDWNNMVVYYNTKHLQEAGLEPPKKDWTIDNFLTAAKKLTKSPAGGGDPERYGFGFAIQYFAAAMPWIFNFGSNLLSDDWGKSNANDPKLVEAITFMRDLVWQHKVSPKPPTNNNDTQNLFAAGKVSMIGGGRWPVLFLTRQNFQDFDVQFWPKGQDQITEFGLGGFPILKATKKVDESWLWVKHLTTKEVHEYMGSLGQSIPARRSVAYDEKIMSKLPPKNWKIFYDSIEAPNARPVPSPAEYNTIESIFRRYLGVIFANEQQPKAALDAAHKEISDVLAKRPPEWKVKNGLQE